MRFSVPERKILCEIFYGTPGRILQDTALSQVSAKTTLTFRWTYILTTFQADSGDAYTGKIMVDNIDNGSEQALK